MRALRNPWFLALAGIAVLANAAGGADRPDFTRDVRPILSEHCFKCHGPDDAARQAKLRLDLRESALAKTESGSTPIVPGKPDASEVMRRMLSHDPDEMMPPPAANKPLSEQKKRILRDWIAAGAVPSALGLRAPPSGRSPTGSQRELAPERDRPLHSGSTRGCGASAGTGGRPVHAGPSTLARSDWSAPHSGRG